MSGSIHYGLGQLSKTIRGRDSASHLRMGAFVAAAVTVAAWAWGLGTFMQWFTDTAIVTTTAIN